VGYFYPRGLAKVLCKWDIYDPLVTKGLKYRIFLRLLTGTNAFVTYLQGNYILEEFQLKLHRSRELNTLKTGSFRLFKLPFPWVLKF
jgi:hypothetical protein